MENDCLALVAELIFSQPPNFPPFWVLPSSPNFYILDEPTNHLDMETIEALGRALNNFRVSVPSHCPLFPGPSTPLGPSESPTVSVLQGGVILVSHDERFIRLVCRELWVCEGGGVTRVEGGFDQYRALLQEQFRREGFL